MTLVSKTALAGMAIAAMGFAVSPAAAQGTWGYVLDGEDINNDLIQNSVDLLGLIRRGGDVGLVNVVEFEARGMAADLESGSMDLVPVEHYVYNVGLMVVATRMTVDWPDGQTIRVAKGAPTSPDSGVLNVRGWDEAWDGTRLNTSDVDEATANFRMQMAFLGPHAAMHAAAYADVGECMLTGTDCDIPLEVDEAARVINVTIYGHPYTITLGADLRPETIESDITFPDGSTHHVVATYYGYRNGFSLGQEALDRFHAGTFWPSRVTHEVDGTTTLDIIVTDGWSNPYTIYPDPELLAQQ